MSDGDDCMYGWRVRGIRRALRYRGLEEGPLDVEQLTDLGHLDQYHYYGTAACDEVATILDLDPRRRVLDVGSGIGGPARYLAERTGCRVQGIDIRSDLVETACKLTERTGLAERVQFETGDITELELEPSHYDHALFWLVLLHLDDRLGALANCRRSLRPGGTIAAEVFALGEQGDDYRDTLCDVLHAPDLPTKEGMIGLFREAGFEDVVSCELTMPWTEWTRLRWQRFRERREHWSRLHGRDVYERRLTFYRTVSMLFEEGAVEGWRLTARVSGTPELPLQHRRDTNLDAEIASDILESSEAH